MFKTLSVLKTCAVACGLLTAASTSYAVTASSTTFRGTITLNNSQADTYFVYDANGGSISGIQSAGLGGFIPAGTFPVKATLPDYISSGTATALGIYAPGHVSVAVNSATFNAAVNTESWDQVFTKTSESSIVTALTNGDSAALQSFLNEYSSDFLSFTSDSTSVAKGGILDFSNAIDGGSLSFTATAAGTPPVINPGPGPSDPGTTSTTPEPSSMFLLGGGLSGLAMLVRKRRNA